MEEQQGLDGESVTPKTCLFQLSSQFYERLKDNGWWHDKWISRNQAEGRFRDWPKRARRLIRPGILTSIENCTCTYINSISIFVCLSNFVARRISYLYLTCEHPWIDWMCGGVFISVGWLILLDLLFGKSREDTMARQVNQVFRIGKEGGFKNWQI